MFNIIDDHAPPQHPPVVEPSEADVEKLARLIRAYTPHDGSFELSIPGVRASRASRVKPAKTHSVHRAALCIVAGGAKRVMLGKEVYDYDVSRMLVFSVDLPVASQVTRASPAEPFLSFRLDLDPHKVAELTLRVYPHGLPPVQEKRAVYTGQSNAGIVNAATRLMELMAQPGDAELLAPLVIDEILIRLLRSQLGGRVAQIGQTGSGVHRVAQAVAWIRDNFAQPMTVEDLAELVHMSVSSFYQHFKALTSMSPLQYQKVLRLQEARRLMASTMMDAGTAGLQVGYLSASQFSREYSRFFGDAPTRDIARLREQEYAADVAR
jgi:AraC-like DNA-binding protein